MNWILHAVAVVGVLSFVEIVLFLSWSYSVIRRNEARDRSSDDFQFVHGEHAVTSDKGRNVNGSRTEMNVKQP